MVLLGEGKKEKENGGSAEPGDTLGGYPRAYTSVGTDGLGTDAGSIH